MTNPLALLEGYAGYVKLLPSLVRTVLTLVDGVKRLADEKGVDIPEIALLEEDNRMLRELPDLAAHDPGETAGNEGATDAG